MNAPLSLFLTHFTAPPPIVEVESFVEELPEVEPGVTLTVAELEAQLEAAAADARAEAEQKHEEQTTALIAEHEAATAEALATARAEWLEQESEGITKGLDTMMSDLRNTLSDGIANVLRPLLADAFIARTKTEVLEALDRLLADPSQPLLSVRCPEDLGATLRAARPDAAIEWIESDAVEVSIVADATRIETRLAAALADLVATEI